eukprot:gene7530-1346_t
MKFGEHLLRNQVVEWQSQYVNYKLLKSLLKDPNQLVDSQHARDHWQQHGSSLSPAIDPCITACQLVTTSTDVAESELTKATNFFFAQLLQFQKRQTLLVAAAVPEDGARALSDGNRKRLANSFMHQYHGLGLLHSFIILNETAIRKILKKFHKATKPHKASRLEELLSSHPAFNQAGTIKNMLKNVEDSYLGLYKGADRKNAHFKLDTIQRPYQAPPKLVGVVGILAGISITLLLQVIYHFVFLVQPSGSEQRLDQTIWYWFWLTFYPILMFLGFSVNILVKFFDFFLADQLSSLTSWFALAQGICEDPEIYIAFPYLALFPSTVRLLQCLRRYHDAKKHKTRHLANAGKYLSGLVSIVLAFSLKMDGRDWLLVYVAARLVELLYKLYWDFRHRDLDLMDWGLMNFHQGIVLRRNCSFPRWFYWVAMVLNIMLRLTWLAALFDQVQDEFLPRKFWQAAYPTLEILRRTIWNCLRVENEHLTNCGEFRVVQELPVLADVNEMEEIGAGNSMDLSTISAPNNWLPRSASHLSIGSSGGALDNRSTW